MPQLQRLRHAAHNARLVTDAELEEAYAAQFDDEHLVEER
jgi:hypothetical protein